MWMVVLARLVTATFILVAEVGLVKLACAVMHARVVVFEC
jgi:hypothetical protein